MVEKQRPLGRDSWEKYKSEAKLEIEADKNLSFDEIAVCEITMNADLTFEPQCRNALQKLQDKSKEAKQQPIEELMKKIDWRSVYNQRVLDILDEKGIATYIDKGGCYGWIDPKGNKHFGDKYLTYPLYTDEETLRKCLEEDFQEPEEAE